MDPQSGEAGCLTLYQGLQVQTWHTQELTCWFPGSCARAMPNLSAARDSQQPALMEISGQNNPPCSTQD